MQTGTVSIQDSDFAGDLEDSKSTSGGRLCILGSHTFVPISWMCKKQTSVSHRSTESEIISLDAGLRLDGIPALDLWDLIVSVLENMLYELADPELTAVYAERLDERREHSDSMETPTTHWETFVQTCHLASHVLRDGLCHEVVMQLVYHTSEDVSALCFDHLVSGPPLCLQRGIFTEKHANDVAVFKRVRGPHGLSVLPLVACASFWCVRRLRIHFESMCEKVQVLQHEQLPVVFLQHDAASLGTCSFDCTSDWSDQSSCLLAARSVQSG